MFPEDQYWRYEAPSSSLLPPSSHVSDLTDEAEQDLSQMVLAGSRRGREGGRGREGFLISSPLVRCYQATHMVRYRLFCHPTHPTHLRHPDTSQQYLNQPDSGE